MKNKFQFVIAVAALALATTQLPVLAQSTFTVPTQSIVSPSVVPLVSSQTLSNAQTVTLNVSTNINTGWPYADFLPLWSTTVCTNPLVVGTTTVSWAFAWDSAGANFIQSGSFAYNNTGTTNASGFTNIPAIFWRGATAFKVSTVTTTGQTNGSNGSLIGQSTSVYLQRLH